uniref:Uncharacterized protein n=1 Tax=Schistosoma japonicum TaxID=6182 RepID=Q5C4Z9_SCHJA|nr:unknown [Schistosoma japonicum]
MAMQVVEQFQLLKQKIMMWDSHLQK